MQTLQTAEKSRACPRRTGSAWHLCFSVLSVFYLFRGCGLSSFFHVLLQLNFRLSRHLEHRNESVKTGEGQDQQGNNCDHSHEVELDEVKVCKFYQRIYTGSDTYIEAQVYVPRNQLGTEYTHGVAESSVSQLQLVLSFFGLAYNIIFGNLLDNRSDGNDLCHFIRQSSITQ